MSEEPSSEAATEGPPEGEAYPGAGMQPSKSNLAVGKTSSMLSKRESHVRVLEPGDEEGGEKRPSEAERKSSERKSLDQRRSAQLSGTSVKRSSSIRESKTRLSGSSVQRGSSFRESRTQMSGTALQRSSSIRQSRESSRQYMRRSSERASKAKLALGSLISFGKGGGYGEYYVGTKAAKFMNSYKLDSDHPFHIERVENILKEVLIEALDNLTYDADKCPKQAKWACSAIRAKVKEQEYDRYKIVTIVTIGEKRYQDMCSVVRFLWDIERDKYAVFVHENMHVYAAAMCFGIYYE